MGYYPFGSRFFSDLAHYVRSGDFVLALIAESCDLNEYAFALGFLAHYGADASGHPLATNLSVALMYPKLAKKYGSSSPMTQSHPLRAQPEGRLQLPNENFDTAELTEPAAYRPTDETYAKLLDRVSGKPISDALRIDILAFYADPRSVVCDQEEPEC